MASSTLLPAFCPSSAFCLQARDGTPCQVRYQPVRMMRLPATSRQQCLLGRSLLQRKLSNGNIVASSTRLSVVASVEFAEKEVPKFRDDLLRELDKESSIADVKGRIVDTCAKVLGTFVETYSGTLTSQPFEKMRSALEQQGLPADKALLAAIWWARANLNRDWEEWSSAKR